MLQNLSLLAAPGKLIAIVGPTGSGKTTLINLLMRFYDPNSGVIKIDGTDIKELTRSSLRGSFAMVLQDTWLFNGTIYENIAYGCDGATREQVESAAKAARIHRSIMQLPDGYDTILTEDGVNIQGAKTAFNHCKGNASGCEYADFGRGDLKRRHAYGASDSGRNA